MSSLKFLRGRIKSVKSTQKIAKAMQLISAARLNKAKENLELLRPYIKAVKEMIDNVAWSKEINLPIFIGSKGQQKHLVLVVTSDRGLCGSFNAAVIKKAKEHCSKLQTDNEAFYIMCIGKRGYEGLSNFFGSERVIKLQTAKQIDINLVNDITKNIIMDCNHGKFTSISAVFNKFISIMKQETVLANILPYKKDNMTHNNFEIEFEPDSSMIINQLIEKYLAAFVYSMLLENAASEHSARMTAMDNAARNARDILHQLDHKYNRTRQALITKELIEVISGAQAL